MINRFLRDHRFIFPKSTNPEYLKTLISLGSIPIIMVITESGRKPVALSEYWWNRICMNIYSGLFNYDICDISDIKHILNRLSLAFNNLEISLHELTTQGVVEALTKHYVTKQNTIRQ